MPYTIIYTDSQTAGRGRLGRSWQSSKGDSLCMSFITPHPYNPCVTLIAALGVYNALKDICPEIKIKWPNDLIAQNKKICGILTESTKDCAIIGIGVNLNNTEFSEDIDYKATSLRLLTGNTFSPLEIAQIIAENIKEILEESGGILNTSLHREYTSLCANIGRTVTFREQTGVATAVNTDGSLIVTTENGTEKITSGEVFVSGIY